MVNVKTYGEIILVGDSTAITVKHLLIVFENVFNYIPLQICVNKQNILEFLAKNSCFNWGPQIGFYQARKLYWS